MLTQVPWRDAKHQERYKTKQADWKYILSQFYTLLRCCIWGVGITIMKWRIRWSKICRKASRSWLGLGIRRSCNITLLTHDGNILTRSMGSSLTICKREHDTCYYSSLFRHFKRLRITLPKRPKTYLEAKMDLEVRGKQCFCLTATGWLLSLPLCEFKQFTEFISTGFISPRQEKNCNWRMYRWKKTSQIVLFTGKN